MMSLRQLMRVCRTGRQGWSLPFFHVIHDTPAYVWFDYADYRNGFAAIDVHACPTDEPTPDFTMTIRMEIEGEGVPMVSSKPVGMSVGEYCRRLAGLVGIGMEPTLDDCLGDVVLPMDKVVYSAVADYLDRVDWSRWEL